MKKPIFLASLAMLAAPSFSLAQADSLPKPVSFSVVSLAVSPNGEYYAAGRASSDSLQGDIDLWRSSNGRIYPNEYKGLKYPVKSVVFSPDGQFFVSAGGQGDYPEVVLWELLTGRMIKRFTDGASAVDAMSFHPQGGQMLTVDNFDAVRLNATRAYLRLWEFAQDEPRTIYADTEQPIALAVFNHDASRVLVSRADGALFEVDVQTGRQVEDFKLQGDPVVLTAQYASHGQSVLLGADNGRVELRRPSDWYLYRAFTNDCYNVRRVAMDQGLTRVLAVGELRGKSYLWVWDMATGRELLRHSSEHGIMDACFAPMGQVVAIGLGNGLVEQVEIPAAPSN